MEGPYRVAGIDVHKKMLAVVVTDAARVGEFRFERRKFAGRQVQAGTGAGTFQQSAKGAQAGFRRRGTAGQKVRSRRTDSEFCAERRTRLWRTMTRTKQQLTRDRVRLQSQLEEARIKLSSHVSDLLTTGAGQPCPG